MGRGRGGSRGRGRGGHRGGRGQRGGFRGRNRNQAEISGKDASHLKEFGEIHPSNDFTDFGPSSSKRGKTSFRGGFSKQHIDGSYYRSREKSDDDSSHSESEEEVTPYNELLTALSGQKKSKHVKIESESESGVEESDQSGSGNESDVASEAKEDEISEGEDSSDSTGENDGDDLSHSESPRTQDSKATSKIDDVDVDVDETEEREEDDLELPDETVILDAEIDPEADTLISTEEQDPFLEHFERELKDSQLVVTKSDKMYKHQSAGLFPVLDAFKYSGIDAASANTNEDSALESFTLDKNQRKFVKIPEPPTIISTPICLKNLHLKPQLQSRIGIANQSCLDRELCRGPLTPMQSELVFLASQYRDVYFPERSLRNQEDIRLAYCVHIANHILKTRTRILHHNAKMASKVEVPEEFRDQSFVRPKVLILVPFKDAVLRIVKILISLFLEDEKGNVANKKRFIEEYGGTTLFMPKTNPKPEDYEITFSGNVDDNFRLGISITKKSMKLFTDFYSSDIIIASPLGLRTIIGAEGESGRDYDFLSSIEITVVDQADVFLMQSWDHVIHLFNHLHLQPVTTHGTDFGRIRPWAVDGLSKYYSQTLVFSSFNCPEINALFSRHCKNFGGLVKIVNPIVKGSISHVTVQLPQVYQRFDCSSLQEMNDSRFDYFVKKVFPNFSGRLMSQTMIFVSSYFDFVRLRNYFKREETSFVQICEYTKDKKISRSRDLFFHNENHFLLYTERAMFFRRLRLKGIGHIIFYQLPQNPHFYSELCNSVQESFQNKRVRQRKNSSVTAVYCQYDAPRLAAVVGSDRASFMLSSDKPVHAFVTGEL